MLFGKGVVCFSLTSVCLFQITDSRKAFLQLLVWHVDTWHMKCLGKVLVAKSWYLKLESQNLGLLEVATISKSQIVKTWILGSCKSCLSLFWNTISQKSKYDMTVTLHPIGHVWHDALYRIVSNIHVNQRSLLCNGDLVLGLFMGLHFGQLANPRKPAMNPACPGTHHTGLDIIRAASIHFPTIRYKSRYKGHVMIHYGARQN